jgi:hypothetical protein
MMVDGEPQLIVNNAPHAISEVISVSPASASVVK